MWVMNFLPEWAFHLLTLSGLVSIIAAFVFSFIPFINRYLLPIKVVGLLLFAAGIFFEGYLYCNYAWKEKAAELQVKIAQAEASSAKENIRIVVQYRDRVTKIKDTTNETINKVTEYVTVHDNKCELPNSVIVLHNSASQNVLPPSSGGAYEGTSDVKVSELTSTVVENYGTCYEIREQLKAWQDWYKTNKDIFEKAFN